MFYAIGDIYSFVFVEFVKCWVQKQKHSNASHSFNEQYWDANKKKFHFFYIALNFEGVIYSNFIQFGRKSVCIQFAKFKKVFFFWHFVEMELSNLVTIRFKSRNATNQTDKGIAEQYEQGGPFDVNLVTSDDKCVQAHRFLLATFSKTWANTLRNAGVDGVIASE